MKSVRCCNCAEYRHEWCDKVADSPDPDRERDCQYYRTRTNRDSLNQLTDEEFALWLEGHCYQTGWLEWLRRPCPID